MKEFPVNQFQNLRFHGTFRDYQQRVLDNADKYLKDGKINIVAAPGSGKTVLGLELIRRIGEPAIVFSPTTAIRQQWGERFKELFVKDQTQFEELFSNDLHNVRLLNSITYQALYTAIEKVSSEEDGDIDCSDVDLFQTMKAYGIKTICLDEAHHLKNEWQKALEKFIAQLDQDVKLISLTATPPYDSEGSEWNRYCSICGEIDEEIFVPELVGQNTLCPHQDYIYFNYPTPKEAEAFREYKKRANDAVDEIGKLSFMEELCQQVNQNRNYEVLFADAKEYIALLVLFHHYGMEIKHRLVRELTTKNALPSYSPKYAEVAIQFLLDSELLSEEQKQEMIAILKTHMVYHKRKVSLFLNEKLKRTLISSVGKLQSIKQIVRSEFASMGADLRLLVLTDYIKKESVTKIATTEEFDSINVVSIFEIIRRENLDVKIGVLSGSLVILPETTDLSSVKHNSTKISGTEYCVVELAGENHQAVNFVGKLFERGELQVLVGTKSLLGEGWDSPCINTLILASFVGSFVLSNQMRGRAIRIDKNNPNKSANIWHLVTVEAEYLLKDKVTEKMEAYLYQNKKEINSYDYDILKRRFDSFMGPNYETGVIESGIERITSIYPPFDQQGIKRINDDMLLRARNREDVINKWNGEVANGKFAVNVEIEIPTEKKVPIFTFSNVALCAMISTFISMLTRSLLSPLMQENPTVSFCVVIGLLCAVWVLCRMLVKMLIHFNPARSMKALGTAVYKTLCQCDLISPSAKVETVGTTELVSVSMYLRNASIHDQNIFNTAMTEMLSPIENPRYILIAKNWFNRYSYELSFACPSIIGKKKEYVEVLAKNLKTFTGNFEPVYTYKENGRDLIMKCRKRSYITYNEGIMNDKYKVSHWE